jgi:phosphopantetheine--protein transferase-like protein
MIGLDIVDRSTWASHRPNRLNRIAKKILSDHELKYYKDAHNPLCVLQHAWTYKEAVFKILSKIRGAQHFIPREISIQTCEDIPFNKWYQVKANTYILWVKSYCTKSIIYSIARQRGISEETIRQKVIDLGFRSPRSEMRRELRAITTSDLKVFASGMRDVDQSFSYSGTYAGYAVLVCY